MKKMSIFAKSMIQIVMRTVKDKPIQIKSTSSKKNDVASVASDHTIKLKAVTDADRQRLRISSYQYLLP